MKTNILMRSFRISGERLKLIAKRYLPQWHLQDHHIWRRLTLFAFRLVHLCIVNKPISSPILPCPPHQLSCNMLWNDYIQTSSPRRWTWLADVCSMFHFHNTWGLTPATQLLVLLDMEIQPQVDWLSLDTWNVGYLAQASGLERPLVLVRVNLCW